MTDEILFQTGDGLSQDNLGKAFGKKNSTQYVEDGFGVTLNNDGTIDVAAGVAHLLHDGQGVTVDADAREELTLPVASGVNHIYLVADLAAPNDVTIETVSAAQSWSDASLKLATVDTSSSTVTDLNRDPDITSETATVDELILEDVS